MAVRSQNFAHARSQFLELYFVWNSSEELVAGCNDDSGILQIALLFIESYSGHTNVEIALLPS